MAAGKVLRRPPEERRGVSVGVDVRALVGASVVVACWPPCRWHRRAGPQLLGTRSALAPFAIPFTGLLLHWDILCRSSVMGLGVHPHLLVKKGQLLVELVPRLRELVEPRPSLGVGGAVVRWREADSGSELLDVEATQTLHSRVGSRWHVACVLRVDVDSGAALVSRRLLT
jgi:hypothetical protein